MTHGDFSCCAICGSITSYKFGLRACFLLLSEPPKRRVAILSQIIWTAFWALATSTSTSSNAASGEVADSWRVQINVGLLKGWKNYSPLDLYSTSPQLIRILLNFVREINVQGLDDSEVVYVRISLTMYRFRVTRVQVFSILMKPKKNKERGSHRPKSGSPGSVTK